MGIRSSVRLWASFVALAVVGQLSRFPHTPSWSTSLAGSRGQASQASPWRSASASAWSALGTPGQLSLASGTPSPFDAAADGITITPQRAKVVKFSDGYITVSQRLMVNKGETDFTSLDAFKKAIAAKVAELHAAVEANQISKALELMDVTAATPDPELGHIVRDPSSGAPVGLRDVVVTGGDNVTLKQEFEIASPISFAPMTRKRAAMMAAVQPFISGAISKTVNLPESPTVEDIMIPRNEIVGVDITDPAIVAAAAIARITFRMDRFSPGYVRLWPSAVEADSYWTRVWLPQFAKILMAVSWRLRKTGIWAIQCGPRR